jgi:hypothetical protein
MHLATAGQDEDDHLGQILFFPRTAQAARPARRRNRLRDRTGRARPRHRAGSRRPPLEVGILGARSMTGDSRLVSSSGDTPRPVRDWK